MMVILQVVSNAVTEGQPRGSVQLKGFFGGSLGILILTLIYIPLGSRGLESVPLRYVACLLSKQFDSAKGACIKLRKCDSFILVSFSTRYLPLRLRCPLSRS